MNTLIRPFFLAISLMAPISASYACRCVAPPQAMPGEAPQSLANRQAQYFYDQAAFVLLAEIEGVEEVPGGTRFKVAVQRAFKPRTSERTRFISTDNSNCGMALRKGELWLLYVDEFNEVNRCSGGYALSSAHYDRRRDDKESKAVLNAIQAVSVQK